MAVKAIPLNDLKSKLMQQFEIEVKSLQKLSSPYIVRLFDVLKTARNVYMFMEYCSGGDLEQVLKAIKVIPERVARRLLRQLLEAFLHLQEKNIIHRDLKLANILTTDKDLERADVKLADFGFARILAENSLAQTMLGTPLFMAPEIFNGQQYNFKADIWSLGVLCYEMLVGRPAFQVATIAELKLAQRNGAQFPANCALSSAGINAVSQMLRYAPEDRPSLADLCRHPFFQDCPPPESPPGESPVVPDFEVIDAEEAELRRQYEDIEDVDEEAPIAATALEADLTSGLTGALLELDNKLYQSQDYERMAEMYNQQGDYSLAYAVYSEYGRVLAGIEAEVRSLSLKWSISQSAISPFQQKVALARERVSTQLPQIRALVANTSCTQSLILVDSADIQVDEAVLVAEARRLLEQARTETAQQRCLAYIRDGLTLVALTEGGDTATVLLQELNTAQKEALQRYR